MPGKTTTQPKLALNRGAPTAIMGVVRAFLSRAGAGSLSMATLSFLGLSLAGCELGVQGGGSALNTKFGGIDSVTVVSPTSVTVNWTQQTGYTQYQVYISSKDSPVATLPTGSTFTINNLLMNTTYGFSVVGTSSEGNQYGISKQIQATTWSNFLGAATATAVDAQSIALTWNYNPGPLFNIYYSVGSKPTISSGSPPKLIPAQSITSSSTGYTVSGLLPNSTYYLMVAAKYADGTDSFQDSLAVSGSLTAQYVSSGGKGVLPVITCPAVATTSVNPIITVSGSLNTYITKLYLDNGTNTPPLIGQITGSGQVTANQSLPVGNQAIIATVTDRFQFPSDPTPAEAEVSGITVLNALPNNGLKVVTATTPSGLTPLPQITTNSISLGPYPTFTVAGAQPGYVTTIYSPGTPAKVLGTLIGNGQVRTSATAPLPRGPNSLYAVVSYNSLSATINGINVTVKAPDSTIVAQPTNVNGGIGSQGVGYAMQTGDFNCDGRPDIAVSAPYGNGVFVYYGSATGLDFSAAPVTNPLGTKPLYIPVPSNITYSYPSGANQIGDKIGFGVTLAVGNFNGDVNAPSTHACSDLAVGASGALSNGGNGGVIVVYYGSPVGLQTGLPTINSFTCIGGGSNSCSPSLLQYWTTGVNLGPAGPHVQYYEEGMGAALAAGDIDGDGYDDLVASSPNADGQIAYGNTGELAFWRGTANGLSPNVSIVTFPTVLTQSAGVSAAAHLGSQIVIGHFVSSPRGSSGPADLAVSFATLSSTATGAGISNPTSQTGLFVLQGAAAPPYLPVNGSGVVTTYLKVLPPTCNKATNPATTPGWTPASSNCAIYPNTLIAADLDQDGYDDLIFSDPGVPNPAGGNGAVYVYYGNSSTVTFGAKGAQSFLPAPGNISPSPQVFYRNDFGLLGFGRTLGFLGDVTGDGFPDIAIGASNSAVSGKPGNGMAFIYSGSGTGINTGISKIISPSRMSYAYFGSSMTAGKYSDTSGFVNLQNGTPAFNDVVVGAIGDSPANRTPAAVVAPTGNAPGGSQAQGTVSIFANASPGLPSTVTTASTILAPKNTPITGLRSDVAVIAGDINGDGFADVVIQVQVPRNMSYTPYLKTQGQYGFVVYYGSASGLVTSRIVAGVTTQIAPSYNPLNVGDPLFVTNSQLNGGTNFNDALFAYTIAPAGDTNGDNCADLLTGYYAGYETTLWFGSPSGLIVAPGPQNYSFDKFSRPSLNPMILSDNYYISPYNPFYSSMDWGRMVTAGDFNGDGISDIAIMGPNTDIIIIYGSTWGPVTDGHIWQTLYYPGYYADYTTYPGVASRADTVPHCYASTASTPAYCTPLFITSTANPGCWGIMNGGNMDGDSDHTDDLVSINALDNADFPAYPHAGVVRIYYGTAASGIDPQIRVDLLIDPVLPDLNGRYLGSYTANWTAAAGSGFGRAYDLNGDGLGDIVLGTIDEGPIAPGLPANNDMIYVIYGVPGAGTPTTLNSGAYIQQGKCANYPCSVHITATPAPGGISSATYDPGQIVSIDPNNSASPPSCSPALRSCNVMRFPMTYTANYYAYDEMFGVEDITGDAFGDLVISRPSEATAGVAAYGNFYIFSGSASGLQVLGTPSTTPTCTNGSCTPTLYSVPFSLPQSPAIKTSMNWYANAAQNAGDIDGDGKRDFLISSSALNSIDQNGNIIGTGIGGFLLFH